MGAKLRTKDIDNWLRQGDVDSLSHHWKHPVLRAYRQEKIDVAYGKNARSAWTQQIMNGATFVFLLDNDDVFKQCHQHVRQNLGSWSATFYDRCWHSSWSLLDVASAPLHSANALDTLDLLLREGHTSTGTQLYADKLRAKLHNEMHGFYKRFQRQSALTALACFDNDTVWTDQKPMMANLMQHAAKNNPADVLGAYLMWACGVRFDCDQEETQDSAIMLKNNALRMEQLCLLANRVGLDTSNFVNLAAQCQTLHQGLGLPLNPQNVFAYTQALSVPLVTIGEEPISSALFV